MRLYLVQHGEAKREEEDPARPLTEKGVKDAEKMAKYAKERLAVAPERILHSGKLRAKQTAEIFAQHLKPPGGVEGAEGLEPLADPSPWAERLETITADLMLVGHLPHLGRLASRLLCGAGEREVVAFKMAGIVCLERASEARWVVLWSLTPDMTP